MAKVRAPQLRGRAWLNTGGNALTLGQLRGKFVLLDFWTFACVNCLHVIEELRPLQERFAEVLVTIGVHSPKFLHEADRQAVIDAVDRYRVRHPVLDDPDMITWDAYAAKAWPTLVLIDPQGYIVAQVAGEGHAGDLTALIDELIVVHRADGTLRTGGDPDPLVSAAGGAPDSILRYPGGLLALAPQRYPGGGFLVSDTAHQQLVVIDDDLFTEQARLGTGERSVVDGAGIGEAAFADPLGTALLPSEVAERAGYDVLIADSTGNALRGLRLADLSVRTVAADLSTPWDVVWFDGRAVIAMAGVHQLWAFAPDTGAVGVLAGTGREGLVDGAADRSWFAQPSGLAVGDNGRVLWVADAETSALRLLWLADDRTLQVRTVIGQGLFEFGAADGSGDQARLQHPLAVAVLPDGSVAIADTYNGAIRRYDPVGDQVSTLADGLAEPSALVLDGDRLVVAESAAHRLRSIALSAESALRATSSSMPDGANSDAVWRGEAGWSGGADWTRSPVMDLPPGAVELTVSFSPPSGQKLDDSCADPSRLDVVAMPADVLLTGAGRTAGLTRSLVFADRVSGGRVEGVLLVTVQVASCDIPGQVDSAHQVGAADQAGAACYLYRHHWQVPFRLIPRTAPSFTLTLTPQPR